MEILIEILNMECFRAFLGVLVGALVTWLVARCYYVKASNDLRTTAEELRHLNEMILSALEQANLVEINRNENGKPVGLVLKLSGTVSAKSEVHGSLSVSQKSDNEKKK